MTDLPRLKNKILLNAIVLACTVLITQNAYSAPYDLPDGLIADLTVNTAKQSIPSKNLTSSDAEELSLRQQAVSYKFLAGIAEKAIAHSVDVLPVAPKDANGVYYIDIASTHKAVTIPSKVKDRLGDQRVSLDALRYIYAAVISLNKADAIKNTSVRVLKVSRMAMG